MEIKPAYANSGPNNPASVRPPHPSHPPSLFLYESDRKGKSDFEVGKTRPFFFSISGGLNVVLKSFYTVSHKGSLPPL